MLRFRPRPPRPKRPQTKQNHKFAAWLAAAVRQAGTDAEQRFVFLVLAGLTFARLASVAFANPAPVAVPGDVVEIGGRAAWPADSSVIPAQVVASPWAAGERACRLDIGLMARHGGALTVLAVRQDGVMLSWAGGATAAGGENCQAGRGGILVSTARYQGLLVHLTPRH